GDRKGAEDRAQKDHQHRAREQRERQPQPELSETLRLRRAGEEGHPRAPGGEWWCAFEVEWACWPNGCFLRRSERRKTSGKRREGQRRLPACSPGWWNPPGDGRSTEPRCGHTPPGSRTSPIAHTSCSVLRWVSSSPSA